MIQMMTLIYNILFVLNIVLIDDCLIASNNLNNSLCWCFVLVNQNKHHFLKTQKKNFQRVRWSTLLLNFYIKNVWSTIERRTPWSNIASVLNKYTKITFLKWNANCNRCWKNISVIIITIFINKIVWFCQDTRSFLGDLLNYFLINWFVNKNQVNNFCKKIFFVNKKLSV